MFVGVLLPDTGLHTLNNQVHQPYRDASLLAHGEKLLRQCGCDEVVVRQNLRAQHNKESGTGFCESVSHAMEMWPDVRELLFISADMPLLTRDILDELCIHGRENNLPYYYRNHCLPVYLPVSSTLRGGLENQINVSGGANGIKELLISLSGVSIPCPCPDRFISIR